MNSDKDSFESRLKLMKKAIKDDAEILQKEFPDDVTYSGNVELIKKEEDEIDEDCQAQAIKDKSDESKK